MSFYFKDPSGNTKELNLSSYWAKDISPTYKYDYSQFWVEPYGIQTHYNIPIKYVTGNSSAGSQTAYINKELYYYPISSSNISSTTIYYGDATTSFSSGAAITSSSSAKSDITTTISYTQKKDINNQSLDFQQIFSTSPFKGTMIVVKTDTSSGSRIFFTSNFPTPDNNNNPWWEYIRVNGWSDDCKCSSSNCPTYTKTESFPILSSTDNFNGNISEITLRLNPVYMQVYAGDNRDQIDDREEEYRQKNGIYTDSYLGFNLTPSSPVQEKTFTYTYKDVSGNSNSASLYVKLQLSNNSITVTTTTPYGFNTIEGIRYYYCGFIMLFSVLSCKVSYNTATPLTTINGDPSLIQYNSTLHSCYFRTPLDEVGPPYAGIFQGYSFYVAGKFSTLKAALTYDSSIAAAIYGTTYTVKNSQSTAYLQDGAICDTAGEKETVYSSNGPVYYIDTFNKTGGLTELKNYLSTDEGLRVTPGIYAIGTTTTKYNLLTVSNTLTLYESTGVLAVAKIPITTYNLTKYILRKSGNYLYNNYSSSLFNDSLYNQTINITSYSWSALNSASSSSAYFYHQTTSSGAVTSFSGTGSVTLPAGSSNYLLGSYSAAYLYSAYTTTRTATLTMNFTYYDKDKFVNRYDTLTYSTTYKGPNACLGIGWYYNPELNYCKIEHGTSNSYGNSIFATSKSNSDFSSSYRASNLFTSTTYFKILPYASSSSGRYNVSFVLSRGFVSTSGYSGLSLIFTGNTYNPYYQQEFLGSYSTYLSPSVEHPTYYYYINWTKTEIQYPTITNVEDNSWYKRKITVKNPNSYAVTMYYTANKCTSSTAVDSSATWANGGSVAANSTATFYITDRSGYSDAYIVVGIYCNNGWCCSSYSEEVKSSPTRIKTFWY